jgi:tetratricopeptide (TPR) repeat protein
MKTKEKNNQTKPKKANVSDKNLQSNIDATMQKDFAVEQTEEVKQAIEILNQTGKVIDLAKNDKLKEAKEELAKIIGSLEILITKNPKLAVIPVDIRSQVIDSVVDIPTAKTIIKAVEEAVDEGYYQTAKNLLEGLTSAYIIYVYMLPMATYPEAMKVAAALLDEGKKEEAIATLVTALNTLAIDKIEIPLPVLRAEEFIKLAAIVMKEDKEEKKEEAKLFLENAEYQLELAEIMGYGKKDKEYKEIYEAIKSLKKAISDDNETESLFDDLSEKIKNFKERLFFSRNK